MALKFAVGALALLAAALGYSIDAQAQAFPNKTIRIIIPLTPGAVSDVNTRRFAEIASKRLGQGYVIEARPGGGGVVGAMAVKQSPPDGYTLFLAHIGTHALNTTLIPNLPYDPINDFVPVAMLFSFPNILIAPSSTPANTVAEMVDLARKKPGGLSYGSQGVGSGAHLLGAMLQQQTGAPFVHVPYPGAQQQLVDMVAGRIDLGFFTYQTAKPLVADGKLKIIASAAQNRRKELPQVPTMAESGYPEMVLNVWYGLVAPAGTPADVVKKLTDEFAAAGRDPELQKQLDEDGMDILRGTPADFTALMKSEAEKWGKVMRAANIRGQ